MNKINRFFGIFLVEMYKKLCYTDLRIDIFYGV